MWGQSGLLWDMFWGRQKVFIKTELALLFIHSIAIGNESDAFAIAHMYIRR